MNYNLLTKLESCMPAVVEMLNGNINILYYSHFPIIIISLLLGIMILYKAGNKISSKVFFALATVFMLWSILDLFTWLSSDTRVIMLAWSLIGIIEILFFMLTFYFAYTYLNNKDLPFKIKAVGFFLLLPAFIMMPTEFNLLVFDLSYCYALEHDAAIYYKYFAQGVAFVATVLFFVSKLKNAQQNEKKQILYLFIGSSLFLLSFFSTVFLSGYLVEAGIITGYGFEVYSLFGTLFFMVAIIMMIVKFKAFNIKLLGAQALVWAMVILIGSQFFFIESNINRILNSVTFVTVAIAGLVLVRSVKKVDAQRELLEKANQNQQSLLHFITHQVKGYMTKSRNIFDAMLAGDYGEINPQIKDAATHGFDSETRGVQTVQSILKASDLKTGKTAFQKETVNLSAVVAEIVQNRQDVAEKKGLDLTFEIEPNIITQADPFQVAEVFKNMISNAIIYTQKGTVHVTLKHQDAKIRFAVVDTGFGLTPEDKKKLFTEGGKSMDSLSINIDSTGYGLFIAKKIVEQHDGNIGAHSEGRGKGSEFFVILPQIS